MSELLAHIPYRIPQVLINRDPVPHVMDRVDLALLGDCDKIIQWICGELEENAAITDQKPIPVTAATEQVTSHSSLPLELGHTESRSPATSTAVGASEGAGYSPDTSRPRQLFEEIDHVWTLDGANLEHKWLRRVQEVLDQARRGDSDEDVPSS